MGAGCRRRSRIDRVPQWQPPFSSRSSPLPCCLPPPPRPRDHPVITAGLAGTFVVAAANGDGRLFTLCPAARRSSAASAAGVLGASMAALGRRAVGLGGVGGWGMWGMWVWLKVSGGVAGVGGRVWWRRRDRRGLQDCGREHGLSRSWLWPFHRTATPLFGRRVARLQEGFHQWICDSVAFRRQGAVRDLSDRLALVLALCGRCR